jgi:hypothetical protein
MATDPPPDGWTGWPGRDKEQAHEEDLWQAVEAEVAGAAISF